MRNDALYSWRNPWFRGSVIALVLATIGFMVIGFVVLPSVQRDFTAQGLWDAICRAAGVPANWGDVAAGSIAKGPVSTSVIVTPAMARPGTNDAIGRGATIEVPDAKAAAAAPPSSALIPCSSAWRFGLLLRVYMNPRE